MALQPHQTLKEVLDALHRFKIHRVWVVDKDNKVTHVLALGDVLEEMIG